MRLLFEVLQFAFELLYSSYLHEMQQMKSDQRAATSPPEISFVEEFKDEIERHTEIKNLAWEEEESDRRGLIHRRIPRSHRY